MERDDSSPAVSFSQRMGMAFRLMFNAGFASQVARGLELLEKKAEPKIPAVKPAPTEAPERVHASGLFVLSVLQREGRLIDFLQQDVTGFSDEDVGAAARVVHSGCRKTLGQYLSFEPAVRGEEGTTTTVPSGFDANRIRLTGNVTGQPPFKGTLKHHGWVASEVRFPAIAAGLDPKVIAPAEVELV